MTNNSYISRAHPVRMILDNAAHGRQPSPKDLDQLLDEVSAERLPEGQSLNRFRSELIREASRIAAVASTGARGPASIEAEKSAAEFAYRMTPEQRALNTSDTRSGAREVEDVVARVFEN